jgi:hypothetical protein
MAGVITPQWIYLFDPRIRRIPGKKWYRRVALIHRVRTKLDFPHSNMWRGRGVDGKFNTRQKHKKYDDDEVGCPQQL